MTQLGIKQLFSSPRFENASQPWTSFLGHLPATSAVANCSTKGWTLFWKERGPACFHFWGLIGEDWSKKMAVLPGFPLYPRRSGQKTQEMAFLHEKASQRSSCLPPQHPPSCLPLCPSFSHTPPPPLRPTDNGWGNIYRRGEWKEMEATPFE